MVRYSDELIDEIRSKNDIVDIISQYVVLKRSRIISTSFLCCLIFTFTN